MVRDGQETPPQRPQKPRRAYETASAIASIPLIDIDVCKYTYMGVSGSNYLPNLEKTIKICPGR